VEGATVTFNPGNEAGRKAGFAMTDADGLYKIGTYATGDGAIAGNYFVTVSKALPSSAPAPSPSEEEYVPPDPDAPAKPAEKPVQMIPPKYATQSTSGLTFEVKSGSDTFDIELKD
jgi:hypothetical protein